MSAEICEMRARMCKMRERICKMRAIICPSASAADEFDGAEIVTCHAHDRCDGVGCGGAACWAGVRDGSAPLVSLYCDLS